jgi:hypothetical protein
MVSRAEERPPPWHAHARASGFHTRRLRRAGREGRTAMARTPYFMSYVASAWLGRYATCAQQDAQEASKEDAAAAARPPWRAVHAPRTDISL